MQYADAVRTATAHKPPIEVVAPKSILIYGMNYAPEIAGVGKYTGEIAEHLASEKGVLVSVVTTPPHYPGWKVQTGFTNAYSVDKSGKIHVTRTPLILRERMGGVWRLLAPLSFAVTSAPVVVWQILRRRPEVVFCVEPTLFAAPFAQLAAWLVGSRTVLHVQDLEVDAAFAVGHLGKIAWLQKIAFAFERFALRRFGSVVTISNRMADRLEAKGVERRRLTVVRNWVDLAHIYPLSTPNAYRAELGLDDDDFVVLYSGNIGAKQGLNVLLDAARALSEERKVHFIIAGEGPLKAGLMTAYSDLPNVHFLQFQPYTRFNEFLNFPDLHVLPQDHGAADLVLPSKLGGMLASGKPVLVTAEKGTELAEFVTGAATVIPPGDSGALAVSIAELYRGKSVTPRFENSSICKSLEKTAALGQLIQSMSQ
ncbi:WcaI family glycosyltransferase [Oryzifoliimicrobium ureilyticus]|uniref:WcaI family glycosyltransferase n=1 Tax=Oryzifoliimicrobium ureilyticus TaxID=3113724 RepID=UPI0030765566